MTMLRRAAIATRALAARQRAGVGTVGDFVVRRR